jgi:hypothetical protein
MTITFPYSSAPVRQIKEIQFGVMSPEEIVSALVLSTLCAFGWRQEQPHRGVE